MPNYVKNIVRINADAETISKMKETLFEDGNPSSFSFDKIIPRPKSLDIESSTRVQNALDYLNGDKNALDRYKGKEREEVLKLGEIARDNLEKYGFTDWYEWSIHNWGTKWDACEPDADLSSTEYIGIDFNTAWSTPEPVFTKLAEMFPKAEIEIDYADEDFGSNCGTLIYGDGEEVSWEAKDTRFAVVDVWGYDESEYEEMLEEYEKI